MTKEREPKKKKLHCLKLTRLELEHLRDVMSVSLPPDASKTMSQSLAEIEDRVLVETFLWRKLVAACMQADIPVGDESPDFIIAPSGTPPLSVYQIASDPPGEEDYDEDEDEDEEDDE